jgi:hypothetical protein
MIKAENNIPYMFLIYISLTKKVIIAYKPAVPFTNLDKVNHQKVPKRYWGGKC